MPRSRPPMRQPLAALAMALTLAGCVSDQTSSFFPGAEPVKAPEGAPRTTGIERETDQDHLQLVAAFGGEYRDPKLKAYLGEIVGRLVPATDRPNEAYRVTILDSSVVNAFALPSGRIYVTRGLLAIANDSSEVAAVLAHEMAHVTLRHAVARGEMQARSELISRVSADVLKDTRASTRERERSRYTIASFSRSQELEADQIGVRTLARAGYDPYGGSRFLRALERSTALKAGSENANRAMPDMLSTHPATQERIQTVMQAARHIGAPGLGREDRARYLSAIDGLAYGDPPRDGLVRGRAFIHPRLGVAFEAPTGFQLENSARAVTGTADSGNRRLLFDALDTPEGQDLEAVLRASWAETIEPGSVQTTEINGHAAVTATSRGKDWNFRLGAIRIGNTTFRLILAARGAGPDLSGLFRQTLGTVREVGPEEAKALKSLRIQVVTAEAADTPETMAARMQVSDRALDVFLVLNGLERGATLQPGERYKIVAG